MPRATLSIRIKELRTSRVPPLTQEALGRKVGKSRGTIGHYEADPPRAVPDPDTLLGLAKALKTTPDYLLGVSKDKGHPARGA